MTPTIYGTVFDKDGKRVAAITSQASLKVWQRYIREHPESGRRIELDPLAATNRRLKRTVKMLNKFAAKELGKGKP